MMALSYHPGRPATIVFPYVWLTVLSVSPGKLCRCPCFGKHGPVIQTQKPPPSLHLMFVFLRRGKRRSPARMNPRGQKNQVILHLPVLFSRQGPETNQCVAAKGPLCAEVSERFFSFTAQSRCMVPLGKTIRTVVPLPGQEVNVMERPSLSQSFLHK